MPKSKCPSCGEEKARMAPHLKVCKALRCSREVPQRAAAAAAAAAAATAAPAAAAAPAAPAAAAAAAAPAAARRNIGQHITTDEQFQTAFLKFCTSISGGSNAITTARLYLSRINSFIRFLKTEIPDFSIVQVVSLDSASEADHCSLPTCALYVDSLSSFNLKSLALNAFKKLVDFLQERIDNNHDFLLPTIRAARVEHLALIRRKASQWAKSVDSQLPLAHQKRLSMLNELAGDDETKKEPSMEKIAFFLSKYLASSMRKERLAEVQDMRKCCLSPAEIRDFLMLEVLLSSTGMRSDAIYQMTIAELHSEKSTQTTSGKWFVAIETHEHKTQKTFGPQKVTMTKSLYDLLVQFQMHVRPQLSVSKPGPEDKLFVRSSMRAGEQSETVTTMSSAITFFKNASDCNLPITAKSFRYYYTHLAHHSTNPEVRQNVAGHLGHSKEISDRVYLKAQEKRQEWANHREELNPSDEQELVAPVDEALQAEAAAERNAIREVAQQKFLKDQKTTGAPYGPKRKFNDEERHLIMTTFSYVQKPNLPKEAFERQIKEHPEFQALAKAHLEKNGTNYDLFRSQVMNSFRASRRK
jgi:hypothetical protein